MWRRFVFTVLGGAEHTSYKLLSRIFVENNFPYFTFRAKSDTDKLFVVRSKRHKAAPISSAMGKLVITQGLH